MLQQSYSKKKIQVVDGDIILNGHNMDGINGFTFTSSIGTSDLYDKATDITDENDFFNLCNTVEIWFFTDNNHIPLIPRKYILSTYFPNIPNFQAVIPYIHGKKLSVQQDFIPFRNYRYMLVNMCNTQYNEYYNNNLTPNGKYKQYYFSGNGPTPMNHPIILNKIPYIILNRNSSNDNLIINDLKPILESIYFPTYDTLRDFIYPRGSYPFLDTLIEN